MDTKNIAAELSNVPVGFLPEPLFNQIARLGVLTFIELVALRVNNSVIEVLLTQRPSTDQFWANLWHNPGTVLRPTDSDYSLMGAFERLYSEEYFCAPPSEGPFFSGFYFEQLSRGKGFGIVNWIELTKCDEGTFFSVNELPATLIKGQAAYIQKCAQDYANYKKGLFQPILSDSLIAR